MSHAPGRSLDPVTHPCRCAAKHVPFARVHEAHHIFPKGWGGPANGETVALCPTAHANVHWWLQAFRRAKGVVPPGSGGGRNRYAYDLAVEGYRRWEIAQG